MDTIPDEFLDQILNQMLSPLRFEFTGGWEMTPEELLAEYESMVRLESSVPAMKDGAGIEALFGKNYIGATCWLLTQKNNQK